MPRSPQLSPDQRGLGHDHRRVRARLLMDLKRHDGSPCGWCGKPMWWVDGTTLAADHTIPRAHGGTIADRLLHGTCNRERSSSPAVTREDWLLTRNAGGDDRSAWCVMAWGF